MRNNERKLTHNDLLLSLLENTVNGVSQSLKKNDASWGHKIENAQKWTKDIGDEQHVTIWLTHGHESKVALYHSASKGTMTIALMEALLYFSKAGAFYAYKAKLDELKNKREHVEA